MKFILSLAVISMSFLSSASSELTLDFQKSTSMETVLYPGGPGKKGKKGKRTNKKRKRKCAKWGRKSHAG